MHEIKHSNPGIVCLQEVDHDDEATMTFFEEQFEQLGYQLLSNQMLPDKAIESVIAVKTSDFTVLDE